MSAAPTSCTRAARANPGAAGAARTRCLVILSTKAAGSSALQNALLSLGGVQCVRHTRHYEHETLYWTKAASLLGLPQVDLIDSEVPIRANRARDELATLLSENAPDFRLPDDPHELVFEGWRALCRAHAPSFVEKSPHHLHQASALDLLGEAVSRLPDLDFRFVWLVRNPLDSLYSAWTRWRTPPERAQWQWLEAQRNGRAFAARAGMGERCTRVHYEALVRDAGCLAPLADWLEVDAAALSGHFHAGSLARWRRDPHFGFQLAPQVAALAREIGYEDADLESPRRRGWPVRRTGLRIAHRALEPVRICARAAARLRRAHPSPVARPRRVRPGR